MTEPQPPATVSPAPVSESTAADGAELSLAELESEIAQAQALVQDLNHRLEQTADDDR